MTRQLKSRKSELSKKKPKLAPKKASKTKASASNKKKVLEREDYHLPVRSEEEQLSGLSEDLQDAWQALRSFLESLGEAKSHTSHRSIMFGRKTCFLFVRPKKSFLEVNFFLKDALDSELVKKVRAVSKLRHVHIVQLIHPDQVERPLTDWIREAFNQAG